MRKSILFLIALLFLSGAAHATHWQRHVVLKDGSTWRCYPPSPWFSGTIVYRCYDTKRAYTYEDAVPLTERSYKAIRERSGLFIELD